MKLVCPECREKFPWAKNTAFPRYCPCCRADIGTDVADDEIVMPFIRSSQRTAQAQSADDVYRQMEQGSQARAEMAASHLGLSASDMSDLKITNIRDASKPGEIAAVPVVNDVTKVMDRGIGGFQGNNGAEFARGTNIGLYPRAGAKTMNGLQKLMGK